MADIIDLKTKKAPIKLLDPKVQELFNIGTSIDKLVINAVQQGHDLFEISAIIAHRLGECIKNLPAKEQQAEILIDIILRRAGLRNG